FTGNVNGDATVDASSNEKVTSIAAGGSFAGSAAIHVNAAISSYSVTTLGFVDTGAKVSAGGSGRVSADESLSLNVIAGTLAAAGSAAVGAAAAVPIVTKVTRAFIGDNSTFTALGNGGGGLQVHTGDFSVSLVDTRFDPR